MNPATDQRLRAWAEQRIRDANALDPIKDDISPAFWAGVQIEALDAASDVLRMLDDGEPKTTVVPAGHKETACETP